MMLDETNPGDDCQENGADEVPGDVALDASALHSADSERSLLGNLGEPVHCSIDDVRSNHAMLRQMMLKIILCVMNI